ncbi:MAG TPA: Na/Pi cotransporter family protein [Candidatus Blautia stercorigallinarum]|uniref:Na/Pi cotransporter family protein n=1 Tax=Candidatus Blautia stercorigallinarum TaxID=2838501 RepID=A0A9D1PFZ4_9FIRM|nr:Na/Pi cotransporter family protein [Candidatus Blautia stercorigallinarum]
MKITDFFSLLGGLALFLYGMQMMSNGLEAAAGNKMKQILEKLTANRFLGVLVGAGITAVIQSSSATTVMVVGFVNSGMMTLQQAVWIIMGANIGTTITGQLIALDVGAVAPLLAFLGVALVVFIKKQKVHHYGLIVAGLGILFIGMDMMSSAMMPLRDSEAFISLMTKFSNPFLGILAGAVFTAIIQSSSASVGILQALASSGLIGLGNAVYVLFGQNIGTCITAILAAIGTNRNAKRTTIIHLMFNIIGTIIFTTVCILTPLTDLIANITPDNVAAQIANMHTLFNIVTTLLLLPFGTYLAKLATKILPEKKDEKVDVMHMEFIRPMETKRDTQIGLSAIAVTSIRKEIHRMMTMAKENVDRSFDAVKEGKTTLLEEVREREEYIDFLNKEISKYISKTLVNESNPRDSRYISALFKVCGNVERIGDHAMNICEYTKMIERQNISFSSEVKREIDEMKKICDQAIDYLSEIGQEPGQKEDIKVIEDIEQKIDDMTEDYRQKQLERMQKGTCSEEGCIIYSEMLTDFERIGDHILNIGQEMGRGKVSA